MLGGGHFSSLSFSLSLVRADRLECWYAQALKEHEPKNKDLYKKLEKELAEVKDKGQEEKKGKKA